MDGQQTSQGIRSMTERFRYPPKSYTKHNSSDMLEDSHDEPTPGVCSPNTTSKPTLTSSVSQKIHMDRIQNENDRTRRKLGDSSNSRSSRITGMFLTCTDIADNTDIIYHFNMMINKNLKFV